MAQSKQPGSANIGLKKDLEEYPKISGIKQNSVDIYKDAYRELKELEKKVPKNLTRSQKTRHATIHANNIRLFETNKRHFEGIKEDMKYFNLLSEEEMAKIREDVDAESKERIEGEEPLSIKLPQKKNKSSRRKKKEWKKKKK